MHYTSIENIHKVIDPLFLDDLKQEFNEIKGLKRERDIKLEQFQQKLASLKFLDPACGSGNFLTETYISLRRLENEILKLKYNKITIGFEDKKLNPIKVSINQFYGIEINDFAVSVAKTALWIAEAQMLEETKHIVYSNLDFFPLKTYTNIIEANALTYDWENLIDQNSLNYIMGNPPFIGGMYMNANQKQELLSLFDDEKGFGEIDYVSAWYVKCLKYIRNTKIKCALVSTNSICQGEQPAILFKYLKESFDFFIHFAYRSFRWDSEANIKAHVHCVIIGFASFNIKTKKLYYNEKNFEYVDNINSYLVAADDVYIESRRTPICDVLKMSFGNMPRDNGGFILNEEEKNKLIKDNPICEKWIHLFPGADEFLYNKNRYCLWLKGANPSEIRQCPGVLERIKIVKDMRESSKAASTRKLALTPTLFAQITQNLGEQFIVIPRHSSEKRKYIPIGFMDGNVIASDSTLIISNGTLYYFGILMSIVHNYWIRAVAGRLEMRYRYSKEIVYNNFPWPKMKQENIKKIEETARKILDARKLYPESILADLYFDDIMPEELVKAHEANDKAVMDAYGFKHDMTESEIVAKLMEMYKKLTS